MNLALIHHLKLNISATITFLFREFRRVYKTSHRAYQHRTKNLFKTTYFQLLSITLVRWSLNQFYLLESIFFLTFNFFKKENKKEKGGRVDFDEKSGKKKY